MAEHHGHARVGGMTHARPADNDAITAANAVRSAVESQAGGPFHKYHPTEMATQVRSASPSVTALVPSLVT